MGWGVEEGGPEAQEAGCGVEVSRPEGQGVGCGIAEGGPEGQKVGVWCRRRWIRGSGAGCFVEQCLNPWCFKGLVSVFCVQRCRISDDVCVSMCFMGF